MSACPADLIASIEKEQLKAGIPDFRTGDTLRVHAKIIEGTKERIQVFEGVVIRRHKGVQSNATFTVRKVSYNIGVERTFHVHSPRIDKIEVMSRGEIRRSRLYYLRDLAGKASRIRSKLGDGGALLETSTNGNGSAPHAEKAANEATK